MTPRPGNSFAVLAKTIHVKRVETLIKEERCRERRALARTAVNVEPLIARQFIEPRSKPREAGRKGCLRQSLQRPHWPA
jgi:hypothetical protein